MRPRALLRMLAPALIALFISGTALADPPSRAIRLAYTAGAVSFLPAGNDEWLRARINRPLWMGDRLWSDADARAELEIGGATLFAAPQTSVSVLDFDDHRAQFEVTQGTVMLNVRTLAGADAIEIDTPNLAFVVHRPGEYRIDVDADGRSTAVGIVRGEAEAFGTNAAYVLRTGNRFRFYGSDLADYDAEPFPARDPFMTWAASRVQRHDRSISARYVSPDMIGYTDLDNFGTWRSVASYGEVWFPNNVARDWAPYRYGHWIWLDPWGWTWVDDAPWGFAPFHYGRWAFVDSRWCWVPGPRNARPVYAPALVAFVGGDNFQVSVAAGAAAGVAWFPLAPGEVYRPAYNASRDYFTRVNVTNTVVNVTNVTNIYNNPRRVTEIRYANVNNTNAVTAVPVQAFAQAQPVQRAAVRVDRKAFQQAPIVAAAPVTPAKASMAGAAAPAQAKPAPRVIERSVVAKQAPPAPAKDAAVRPNVRVVQTAPTAQPIPAAPPQAASRGQHEARGAAKAPEAARPPQANAPRPQMAQPAPEQRGVPAQGRVQREAAKAPEPPRPPQAAAPQPQPQPRVAQPTPEQRRGPAEGRGQREAAKAPEPPRPPQAAAPQPQPHVAQPKPQPQPRVAQPAPEQRRGPPEERGAARAEPQARATPAPQPPHAALAPQVQAQGEPARRADRGPPPGKGKDRDAEKNAKE